MLAGNHQPRPHQLGMAADDVVDLRGMHEHAAHLGGLIGPAQPALDPHVGAAAGAHAGEHCRQIAGGEPDQRVLGIEHGHQHLADLALRHRLSGPGTDDLDDHALVHHQAFARLGLVGDQSQIGSAVALVELDAARLQPLAQRCRQRLAGDQPLAQAADVLAQFVGLLQDDVEEGRCAGVADRTQIGDRPHLQLGLADSGREHRAAQRLGAGFEHVAGRREVIGEGVVHQLAAPETGGVHGAGEAPVIGRAGLRLVDRPRRLEYSRQLAERHRGQAAERRPLLLPLGQLALAQHGQPGQRLAGGDRSRLELRQHFREVRGTALGDVQQPWQLLSHGLAAVGGRAGFQCVVVLRHLQLPVTTSACGACRT